ncbi:MAG: hypothetical protein AB2392_21935 [Neobacillus sp.]
MFITINGVQIKEHDETKDLPNILEKSFEIEYLDNVYLNNLVCLDLINIKVKETKRKFVRNVKIDHGRKWMYVVKHTDFALNRAKYGEVCCIVHDKIGEYLAKEYSIDAADTFLIDSMDKVYIPS